MLWLWIVLAIVVLVVVALVLLYNRLVRLRNRVDNAWAQEARTVEQQADAENVLTAAIGRLFAVAEAYPELRASENFQQLQTELSETEGRIAVSRQVYNDTVLTYNNAVQTVPANLVAGMLGFDTRTFFEVEEPVREAPAVRF